MLQTQTSQGSGDKVLYETIPMEHHEDEEMASDEPAGSSTLRQSLNSAGGMGSPKNSFARRGGFEVTLDQLTSMFTKYMDDHDSGFGEVAELGGTEGVAALLQSDLTRGLPDDPKEALISQRKHAFGDNGRAKKKTKWLITLMWEALQDPTLLILIAAAIVSLVLGLTVERKKDPHAWLEGTAILGAVALVVCVGAFNDWRKEKQFAKLYSIRERKEVRFIRNGENVSMPDSNVVVGDVLFIDTGDQIPADGIFISGNHLKVSEATMTGESDELLKSTEKPILLAGTEVMDGNGRMLVLAVGKNTESGRISHMLTGDGPLQTNLQVKLEWIAKMIGLLGVFVATGMVFVLTLRFVIDFFHENKTWENDMFGELLHFFILGITILVVAIPEGLPLAVTLSLAYSVQKMMKDHNLVRVLSSCETMGGATTICTDKTGTLTTNQMTVTKFWLDGKTFSHDQLALADEIDATLPHHLAPMAMGIARNSKGELQADPQDSTKFRLIGSKTDCALLVLLNRLGCSYKRLRSEDIDVLDERPFSSAIKRSHVVLAAPKGDINIYDDMNKKANYSQAKPCRLYLKGAGEIVLGRCSSILSADGSLKPLDDESRQEIERNVIETYAESSLRVIALAYRDFDVPQDWEKKVNPDDLVSPDLECEQDLTLLGFCGIKDPVRPEVPEAVARCQRAGITVRMVTGDNEKTARAIARECGILTEDGIVMQGLEFRTRVEGLSGPLGKEEITNRGEFEQIWPSLQVLARSAPRDKHILVTGLRNVNQVVAVTGDGTNDALALKKADVGFAMGIAGTEVAKNASDIILMNDSFDSIVKAVMWGRNTYNSIRKFLQFQLTVNVVALCVAFVSSITIKDSPLTAVQMLWVNLIMDTFAALALATEAPTDDLLNDPPYGKDASIVSPYMWRNIFGQSLYQIAVLFTILFYGPTMFNIQSGIPGDDQEAEELSGGSVHFTMVFNVFVLMQVFNEINARKVKGEVNVFKGIFSNYIYVSIMVITIVTQFLLVTYGGRAAKTKHLDLYQWLYCLAFGAGSLVWQLLLYFFPTNTVARLLPALSCYKGPKKISKSKEKRLKRTNSSFIEFSARTSQSVYGMAMKDRGMVPSGKIGGRSSGGSGFELGDVTMVED